MDNRSKMLVATVHKLFKRGAIENITRIFEKSHTADVATIIGSFQRHDQLQLFELESDVERRGDVFSHLEEASQKELLLAMDMQSAEKIVAQLETDDAADVLSLLPEEMSKQILAAMDSQDSVEVSDLMGYPEDSAGGLMSSDFLALDQELTIEDAIRAIQTGDDDVVTFYIYVVNDSGHLLGVLSLKQLLIFKPKETLKQIMTRDVIKASVDLPQDEVARMVERYDFLSIPVTDESNKLVGVITVDDVIDVIREESEEELLAMGRVNWGQDFTIINHLRARLPWMLLTFLASSLGFALIFAFISYGVSLELPAMYFAIAAFLPMILSMGATAGNQAVTVTVGLVRGQESDFQYPWRHILSEVQIGFFIALIFAAIVFAALYFGQLFSMNMSLAMSAALFSQIVLAVLFGASIPIAIKRIQFDPTVASVPVLTVFADTLGITVLCLAILNFGISI